GPWMYVESRTASAYMAYLAGVLSRIPGVDMDPITDAVSHLEGFALDSEHEGAAPRLQSARMAVLDAILPAPAEHVEVADLAEFKADNRDLLPRFRREVEQAILQVAE